MRRAALILAALAATATSLLAPASQAGPPAAGPLGAACSFDAVSGLSAADRTTGALHCGPAEWDRPYWLHGSIQVDEADRGSGTAAEIHCPSSETGSGSHVVVCGQLAEITSGPGSPLYVCGAVSWPTASGPNWLYWHGEQPGPGHWTNDANQPCSPAEADLGSVVDLVDETIGVSSRICQHLQHVHNTDPVLGDPSHNGPETNQLVYVDHEGDIFVDANGDGTMSSDEWVWDCPVYWPDDEDDGAIDY